MNPILVQMKFSHSILKHKNDHNERITQQTYVQKSCGGWRPDGWWTERSAAWWDKRGTGYQGDDGANTEWRWCDRLHAGRRRQKRPRLMWQKWIWMMSGLIKITPSNVSDGWGYDWCFSTYCYSDFNNMLNRFTRQIKRDNEQACLIFPQVGW